MTAALGANFPPLALPGQGPALESGARWGRFPLWPGVNHFDAANLLRAGILTLGIVDKTALVGSDYRTAAERIIRAWGPNLSALQVGNEPDQQGDASSSLPAAELSTMLQAFREARDRIQPTLPLIGPGLASGQVEYLDTVDLRGYAAIAVHPYAKDQWGAAALVSFYQKRFQLPVWVTEFEWSIERCRALRAEPNVPVVIMYCWQRWAGWAKALFDEYGNPTPIYREFQHEAGGPTMTAPTFLPGGGFEQYAQAHSEVGKPLSSEEYFSADTSIQVCEGGVLYYARESNAVVFLPKKA